MASKQNRRLRGASTESRAKAWRFPFAASVALSVTSCGGGEGGDATANVELIDATRGALTTARVRWVNGMFGPGCKARTGKWSISLDPAVTTMDNPPLSVIRNDSACTLKITEFVGDETYRATPPLVLTTAFTPGAAPFNRPAAAGGKAAFYGNARVGTSTFEGPFTLTLLVSGDAAESAVSASGTYATSRASASVTTVTSPDYAVDISTLAFEYDAYPLVTAVTGSMTLAAGKYPGEGYVVVDTMPPSPTFADYDAAYTAGKAQPLDNAATIAGTALLSVGSALTSDVVRTVLVKRSVNGVPSYQVVTVTFPAQTSTSGVTQTVKTPKLRDFFRRSGQRLKRWWTGA